MKKAIRIIGYCLLFYFIMAAEKALIIQTMTAPYFKMILKYCLRTDDQSDLCGENLTDNFMNSNYVAIAISAVTSICIIITIRHFIRKFRNEN